MQFDNVQEYIEQVYDVKLPPKFIAAEAPPLLYLKLVRFISQLGINTHDLNATQLFANGVHSERATAQGARHAEGNQISRAYFALADLHEVIEMMIRKSGVKKLKGFDDNAWSDGINS